MYIYTSSALVLKVVALLREVVGVVVAHRQLN